MSEVPGSPASNPGDLPHLGGNPTDPTIVQPITAAGAPFNPVPGRAVPKADQPWYSGPGGIAAGAAVLVVLLGLLLFALFGGSDDNDSVVSTDGALAMQITVNRTAVGEPFATQQIATVTGPTDTPNGFLWVLPPNGVAPDPITAVTDGNGDVLFRWAPLEQLIDPAGWRSTLVISEELAPNVTLDASAFNCLLEARVFRRRASQWPLTSQPHRSLSNEP